MEEFLLGGLFAGEELDVVDEQQIDGAITILEVHRLVVADGVDQLVGELLRAQIRDLGAGVVRQDVVGHRMHEVGLAQAHAAVDEERVVGFGGAVGHGLGGGMGEVAVRADHEGLEGVLGVQNAQHRTRGAGRRRGGGRGGRGRGVGRARRVAAGGRHHELDAVLDALDVAQDARDQGVVMVLAHLIEHEPVGHLDLGRRSVHPDQAGRLEHRLVGRGAAQLSLDAGEGLLPEFFDRHRTLGLREAQT
ncbi:hypothetical protein D3C72_1219150 [compost metagenome]